MPHAHHAPPAAACSRVRLSRIFIACLMPGAVLGVSLQSGLAESDSARAAAVDTNTVASAAPPPAFCRISGWEFASIPFVDQTPAIQAVALLGAFYHKPLSATQIRDADLSPLAWPRVFAGRRQSSRLLRRETEALLAAAGLAYRSIVALDSGELADSITAAIAAGSPVLFNAPDAPIFYGYDRREPDHWWWVQQGATTEIVYESERIARFHYWDDNPAANLAWIVTGPAPPLQDVPQPGGPDYRLLDAVRRSVSSRPESGIISYPLTLRKLGERLRGSDTLPELSLPVDAADPIGVYRALNARQRLIASLERLVPMALDSSLSAPLRLAQYFYHNSTRALISFAETLYERPDTPDRLEALRLNWQDNRRRVRAYDLLQKVLRAEKDAHGALSEALTAHRHNSGK